MTNEPPSERYRAVGKKWVEADFAANMLEETKSAVLSQMQIRLVDLGMPVTRAEVQAKASDEYMMHLTKMVAARRDANLALVDKKAVEMEAWEHNSADANRRAEMKL